MKKLILMLCILTLVSCNKKEKADDTVTPPTLDNKDTLSSWDISTGGWQMRLDLNGANLQGTPFTMVIKFADNGEVHCVNTILAGSEGAGTYETGACTDAFPSTMATSVTGVPFESVGPTHGTYTNDGTNMIVCKNGTGNCFTWEI